ncbi:hypothetical protein PL81_27210 [Streptomyces sp. RSD-27]|nr:hypothetical protein PL81_27210 [Streptomyces sp. RSD-27]
MKVGLLSRCMGANATFMAMTRHPELFADIHALVAIQPISMRAMVERNLEAMGIADQFEARSCSGSRAAPGAGTATTTSPSTPSSWSSGSTST